MVAYPGEFIIIIVPSFPFKFFREAQPLVSWISERLKYLPADRFHQQMKKTLVEESLKLVKI